MYTTLKCWTVPWGLWGKRCCVALPVNAKSPCRPLLYPFSDLYAFFYPGLQWSSLRGFICFIITKSFLTNTICIPLFEALFWLKLPKPMLSLTLHKFWMGGNKVWNHPLAGDVASNLDKYLWPSVTLQSFNNSICCFFLQKKRNWVSQRSKGLLFLGSSLAGWIHIIFYYD